MHHKSMTSQENQVQKAITSWTDMELGIPKLQLQWVYLLNVTVRHIFVCSIILYTFHILTITQSPDFQEKLPIYILSICTEDLYKELKINCRQACP